MNAEHPTPDPIVEPAETAPSAPKPRRKKAVAKNAAAPEAAAPAAAEADTPAAAPRRRSPRKPAAAKKAPANKKNAAKTAAEPAAEPAETLTAAEVAAPEPVTVEPALAEAAGAEAAPSEPAVVEAEPSEAVVAEAEPATQPEVTGPSAPVANGPEEQPAAPVAAASAALLEPIAEPAAPPRARKRKRRRGKSNGEATALAKPSAGGASPTQESYAPAIDEAAALLAGPAQPLDAAPADTDPGPLQIISLGLGSEPALPAEALAALRAADCIVGDAAALDRLAPFGLEADMLDCAGATALRKELGRQAGRRAALVVAGDALGDAATAALVAELGPGAFQVHPAVGPVQAALARLGLPADAAEFVDLRRDSLASLRARLRRHRLLAIRLAQAGQAAEIGTLLAAAGFHDACSWLCDGFGDTPRVAALLVRELASGEVPCASDAVLLIATGHCASYPEFPGLDSLPASNALPPAARLLALSWLQPAAGETGWVIDDYDADLALDWARAVPQGQVLVAGSDPTGVAQRAALTGVGDNLLATLAAGPADSAAWPAADAVFLRGGAALPTWLQIIWKRLPPGGRLVVSAEDEQARGELNAFAAQHPALRWEELSCSRGETLGGRLRFTPAAPVRLVLWQKPRA